MRACVRARIIIIIIISVIVLYDKTRNDNDRKWLVGEVGGGGGGVGVGNLGVILVRVCEPVFQNLPHSYTWPLKKTDPFIYLIIQNVDLFIYCPLIFCTHFLLVVRQISQSIHVIPRG